MIRQIVELHQLQDFKLDIIFQTGEHKIFDLKPHFVNESVFTTINNPQRFKQVENHGYFISWPGEIDLSADTVFYEGVTFEESTSTN